jgi:hypothetical protein
MTEKLTKKKAKELTLEIWRYLAEHPEINTKDDLPEELLSKIRDMCDRCPLCTFAIQNGLRCRDCVLPNCCYKKSPFNKWISSETKEERADAAMEIVRRIEAWDIGEE